MQELTGVLLSSLIAIISAGGVFIVSWINNKKNKLELTDIKQSIKMLENNETKAYIVCQHCGTLNWLNKDTIKFEEV